jgi:hypothetical protein
MWAPLSLSLGDSTRINYFSVLKQQNAISTKGNSGDQARSKSFPYSRTARVCPFLLLKFKRLLRDYFSSLMRVNMQLVEKELTLRQLL